jgi:hypothetical protein
MGYKNVMKTILDPIGSLVGESIFDDMGSSSDAPEQSAEDKERDRRNGIRQGIRDAAFDKENNLTWESASNSGYKRGGPVRQGYRKARQPTKKPRYQR